MTPQLPMKTNERIDNLTEEIEELQRQKYKLQEVYDFGDFIETHNLIDQEIERLRHQLRKEKTQLINKEASVLDKDKDEIEEEGWSKLPSLT